jgi:hypothetical protein
MLDLAHLLRTIRTVARACSAKRRRLLGANYDADHSQDGGV